MSNYDNPNGSPPPYDPWTQNTATRSAASNSRQGTDWERELIGKIAMAAVTEQRRARRWGIFFKSVFLLYLIVSLWLVYSAANWEDAGSGPHAAVISVDGVIASGTDASADRIVSGLRAAFKEPKVAGIVIRINSPGGSPVQAGQIYDAIMTLREEYPEKPVYAVALDVCASGGYYIAAAAQEIYANQASIIGSIGVRADSFGFVEAMDRLGIERRLYTAGDNKAMLDPFLPEDPVATRHLQDMLQEVHQQFQDAVVSGRGDRLQQHPELFSGLVWSGAKSLEIGLIDGFGTTRYVAEKLIGVEDMVDYTIHSSWLDRVLTRIGDGLGQTLLRALNGSSSFSLH
jgi:protease-4